MNTDEIEYTVCGFAVDADPPELWGGVCGTVTALDADGAIGLMGLDVIGQVSADARTTCVDLALSCVHPGAVDVVGRLARATLELTFEDVRREETAHRADPDVWWTVCGNDRSTMASLCYQVQARSWLLAYVAALETAALDDYEPLFARMHPGRVDRIGGYPYADPLARDLAGMRMRAADVWGVDLP